MSKQSLREETAKGLFWGGFSNGLQQLLNLVFGIVLARLLTRSDYGMVGMLAIFSAIASILQESGFISALANKKEVTSKDYNAVFWFSILCSSALYILLFFLAPFIADFYKIPELTALSRFCFLSFFISSFGIAPRAILFRNLKVKENTIIATTALICSGTIGIIMAANGFAYWGLATQSLIFVIIIVILNWHYAHWHPTFHIDFTPIKEMFGFSSKLLLTNIFGAVNNNLFSVLLGKFYTKQDVGDFSQANKWNNMGQTFIIGMMNSVAQPVLAGVADDKVRQLAIFRKMLRFTALVSFPVMFGLSLVSKELIVITITDKWLDSAKILQLLCIYGAFAPINNLFSTLIISRGHSTVYLINTIGLCLLQLLSACLAYPYGITTMIYFFTGINILWMFVWHYFVNREIHLSIKNMLKDISPYLLLSATLYILVYFITMGISNIYLCVISKIIIMSSLYFFILWKMKSVILKECIQFIISKKRKP
ncbi:MAG: lipopolysaccharide biosynthesis protein [Bacteroidaceae bacterium]|nr:lipopolysaccharide biosynthesis protein [Bacteroidaceae bacterium]